MMSVGLLLLPNSTEAQSTRITVSDTGIPDVVLDVAEEMDVAATGGFVIPAGVTANGGTVSYDISSNRDEELGDSTTNEIQTLANSGAFTISVDRGTGAITSNPADQDTVNSLET